MDNYSFFEDVKQKSGFSTWRGKTHSTSTRFHHLLLPPGSSLIGNYHIASAGRQPSADPALDWATWILSEGPEATPSFDVNIREFENIEKVHDFLLGRLCKITRGGVDFSPIPDGPGDICILNKMARDNLIIEVIAVNPGDKHLTINILKHIDAWLLTEWPALIANAANEMSKPLEVRITPSSPTVKVGTDLELTVEVNGSKGPLVLNELSHRFLAEPGRIIRRGDKYVFFHSRPGRVSIRIDVVGPDGTVGHASASLKVVR